VLAQIYQSIDAFLFNVLMKNEKFCSCRNGFQIKLALSLLVGTDFLAGLKIFPPTSAKKSAELSARLLLAITEAANCLVMDKNIFEIEEVLVTPPLFFPHADSPIHFRMSLQCAHTLTLYKLCTL